MNGRTDLVGEITKDEHTNDRSGKGGGGQGRTIIVSVELLPVDPAQYWAEDSQLVSKG